MGCLLASEAGSIQPSHLSPRAAISAPFPEPDARGHPKLQGEIRQLKDR